MGLREIIVFVNKEFIKIDLILLLEMAEHHDVLNILDLSRNLVDQLEFIIEAN